MQLRADHGFPSLACLEGSSCWWVLYTRVGSMLTFPISLSPSSCRTHMHPKWWSVPELHLFSPRISHKDALPSHSTWASNALTMLWSPSCNLTWRWRVHLHLVAVPGQAEELQAQPQRAAEWW